ncbi:AraC family transcriptional regulator [Paenibacillus sp. CGMCC 1.16610]|uniref:AraC family transcriptional regulator n=1 Tax=Paenibacillus anseongense TaxID=2682845 RepID=A0ABW9U7N6_9BACL|nr:MULTISPECIES: AraC family transcriptional regulator [Paenibacillus]MBA2938881.1 AraC family transcriptional regulator [Paenibacillus sp. CGMCC 1.16610]MVQ34843.1 AraC family transcriptional regulator [Paenibacillus anseongense]
MNDWSSSELLEHLFFSSIRIYCSNKDQNGHILSKRTIQRYAICLITKGTGVLSINEVTHTAQEGDIFILLPGMIIEGTSQVLDPIHYSVIFFSCFQVKKHRKEWHMEPPHFPVSGKHPLSSQDRAVKERIERILAPVKNRQLSEKLDLKYQLHSLLTKLMIVKSAKEQEPETLVGMEYALAFISENYMKDLKISQLAKMAGYSINHFTRIFKNHMNMTPTEYFLQQRIRKAKQLLFSSEKMKEVAQQVGYKDEHYFSRAFKKEVGVAPTLYMKDKSRRIAALYYGLDDYLMTLGLYPVAFLSYQGRVTQHASVPLFESFGQEAARLESIKLNYDKLIQTKPDLILTSDRYEMGGTLECIAPTIKIRHSNDYTKMLSYLASILGKESQAASWKDMYADRKNTLQNKIIEKWGSQTAYYIRVSSDFYRIYGSLNQTGTLLYDDLGLKLPVEFPHKEWAIDFQLSDLKLFNPDHIFLMTDPTEIARQRLQQLMLSEEWLALEAVRKQHVYEASDLLFKTLGPTGRLYAMNQIASQLQLDKVK